MIYPYHCDECGLEQDIVKPVSECSNPEKCKDCDSLLRRVYTAPLLYGTSVYEANHNPALGQTFTSKRQEQYYKDKHNLIEVGNESTKVMKRDIESERRKRLDSGYDDIV